MWTGGRRVRAGPKDSSTLPRDAFHRVQPVRFSARIGNRGAIGIVVSELARSVDYVQAPVGEAMDAHPNIDEVTAVSLGQDTAQAFIKQTAEAILHVPVHMAPKPAVTQTRKERCLPSGQAPCFRTPESLSTPS